MFVLSDENYQNYVDLVLNAFLFPGVENHFVIDKLSIKRFNDYTQMYIFHRTQPNVRLKIDLINDVAIHFGGFQTNKKLGKVDSWRNILSNKICALFRFEPKDIADIWILSKNNNFLWKEILIEAKQKELGVEPDVICNILKSFPIEQLKIIKWVSIPDYRFIKNDISVIADEILLGSENSLMQSK